MISSLRTSFVQREAQLRPKASNTTALMNIMQIALAKSLHDQMLSSPAWTCSSPPPQQDPSPVQPSTFPRMMTGSRDARDDESSEPFPSVIELGSIQELTRSFCLYLNTPAEDNIENGIGESSFRLII